ncbi:hypothetical protein IFR05_003369 [Cadophora sp. M221]|nr:hypothetical protein IFR05_003369 [Cadophora sp. M221]
MNRRTSQWAIEFTNGFLQAVKAVMVLTEKIEFVKPKHGVTSVPIPDLRIDKAPANLFLEEPGYPANAETKALDDAIEEQRLEANAIAQKKRVDINAAALTVVRIGLDA